MMKKTTCFDLRAWAEAKGFKWCYHRDYEPGYGLEEVCVIVPCKYGVISPGRGDNLSASYRRTNEDIRDGVSRGLCFKSKSLDRVAAILEPERAV